MLHTQPKTKVLVLAFCLTGLLSGCGLLETFGEALGGVCRRPLVVTTEEDKNDGACTSDDCSLREAVITANACDGHQEIILEEDAIYRLTIEGRDEDESATGDLDITGDVDFLYVPGERSGLDHSSHRAVIDAMGIDRVLDIHSGRFFSGPIIIRGGNADYGGGIRTAAGATGSFDVFLQISDNSASQDGGGVYNEGEFYTSFVNYIGDNHARRGSAIYSSGRAGLGGVFCSITANQAQQAAIFVAPGGEARLVSCGIVNNQGGAIFNQGELLFQRGELISNEAMLSADLVVMPVVIFNDEGASAEFENTTITGNYAGEGRGTLVLSRGTLMFTHITIYQNQPLEVGLASEGAGSVQLHNSILGQSGESLCEGEVESTGGNVFDVSGCGESPELGDIVVGSGESLGLLPLSFSVSVSFFPLEGSSPAVDAGTDPCLDRDIRAASRPIDGDGDGVARCDSGAYEYEPWGDFTSAPIYAPLPDETMATPSTPEMREAIARPTGPTTCRSGPSVVYPPLGYFDVGDSLSLQSRNADASWLEVQGQGVPPCWVNEGLLEIDPTFDLMALPPGIIPPTPTWTPPSPTQKPGPGPQGCWHQGPNDNQPLCYVPCPPNPNPGGACTP